MSDTDDALNGEGEDELSDTQPAKTGRLSFTASLVRQGRHRFFTLAIQSKVLVDNCSVDMRAEDPINGFQRRLDKKRAKDIAEYIENGFGTIPGSVILSAQPEASFEYISRTRTVSFKRQKRAFLILDGQHRVYGFHFLKKSLRVPVVIFNDLSKSDEARLFRDINTNQRPVPNELLLDINRLAKTETSEQAILHDVFDYFDHEPNSPLFGLMSPSEKTANKISRVTFNAALRAVFNSFGDSEAKNIYDVTRNYVQAWVSGLRTRDLADHITDPIVFRAIMLVFPLIAGRVSDRYRGQFSVENFTEALAPLIGKLRKSDLNRPGASHLDLNNTFRKRLESGFSIGSSSLF